MQLATLTRHIKRRVVYIGALVIVLVVLPAFFVLPEFLSIRNTGTPAPGSLYSYRLDGSSSTIANGAAANGGVSMTLAKNWSATSFGVMFSGNTSNKQSVGYAKPASGSTLGVSSNLAVGASVMIRYKAPASSTCFSDSPNVTQIGKFGAKLTQVKIQLSNCGKSSTNVFPQCRMAGANTGTNVLPVMGTTPLVDGEIYIIRCTKSPDPASGNASLELQTIHIGANGNTATTNNFSIAKTGNMNSTAYLTVANQYPLKSQSNNTDQFNGEIARVAYCTGADLAAARACQETEVAEPTANPPEPGAAVLGTAVTNERAEAKLGDQFLYTVTVKNTANAGDESAANVAITLGLPSNLTLTDPGGGTVTGNAVSWAVPSLAPGQQATAQVAVQVTSGNPGDTYTATASVTADTACASAGSVCSATDTDMIVSSEPAPTPVVTEWITNASLETDMTGWTGKYGATSSVAVTRDAAVGRTGSASLKITGLSGASNRRSGVNANPRWVTSTTANTTYTGSVWAKAPAAGHPVVLLLREWSGSTLVGEGKVTVVSPDANWFKLEVPITAKQTGTSIAFAVYGDDVDAGETIHLDDFSLTSPAR